MVFRGVSLGGVAPRVGAIFGYMPQLVADATPPRFLTFDTSVPGLPAVVASCRWTSYCEVAGFSAGSACWLLSFVLDHQLVWSHSYEGRYGGLDFHA